MKITYFISGHRNLSKKLFDKYYVPKLKEALANSESCFVVGDYMGVDSMAQKWLSENIDDKKRVTVYHMFKKPRNLLDKDFKTCGGFKNDVQRDSAMTNNSNIDIAFITEGRWTSGTSQNILRRYEIKKE